VKNRRLLLEKRGKTVSYEQVKQKLSCVWSSPFYSQYSVGRLQRLTRFHVELSCHHDFHVEACGWFGLEGVSRNSSVGQCYIHNGVLMAVDVARRTYYVDVSSSQPNRAKLYML
jgi:hypothetical protein